MCNAWHWHSNSNSKRKQNCRNNWQKEESGFNKQLFKMNNLVFLKHNNQADVNQWVFTCAMQCTLKLKQFETSYKYHLVTKTCASYPINIIHCWACANILVVISICSCHPSYAGLSKKYTIFHSSTTAMPPLGGATSIHVGPIRYWTWQVGNKKNSSTFDNQRYAQMLLRF